MGLTNDETAKAVAYMKLLLTKYNIVHSDLAYQFQVMTVACSSRAVGGNIRLGISQKAFVVRVYTDFLYERKKVHKEDGGYKTVYLRKAPAHKILKIKSSPQYKMTCNEIVSNLKSWLPALSWGKETKIRIYVDNRRLYES